MRKGGPGRLERVLNVALLAGIALVLLMPGGPAARFLTMASDGIRARSAKAELFDSLAARNRLPAGGNFVVAFADYECPYCRRMEEVLDAVASDLTIVTVHWPLVGIHPYAEAAARSSICSRELGRGAEMHDWLMTSESWMVETHDWEAIADRIGIPDPDAFMGCLTAAVTTAEIDWGRSIAERLGLSGTPAFVGKSGQVLRGQPTAAALRALR